MNANLFDSNLNTFFISFVLFYFTHLILALTLINGLKRGRFVTRAQTMVVRMFDAICNCTQQSAAALPRRVQTARSLSLSSKTRAE